MGDLLSDLNKALAVSTTADTSCKACRALRDMPEDVRGPVADALAGTLGSETLANVLAKNGYPVGRRAIARHREEAHTP